MTAEIKIKESVTVAEFIKALKKFPQDWPVRVLGEKECEIRAVEEFYDGDPCNPNCNIIQAVTIY